ncbi:CIC11C00000005971 [Sungouiella intermedia]|uniref:CIC11C00000005971 n=1 Tax=Sungouiella intermedia TaxID=45354 RepID=A0A1L0DVF1_9ASCO|nr:CIC11C00000005971 [[Candida] intermedia]
MDYVQLDKMWELLRILEKYFAEKDLKWKLSQTSLVDSGSDDLWEADLEALWNFEGPLLLENMDK